MNVMCAFTRHWDKAKHSPFLRARNWYRDTHIIPFKEDGDFILCKVIIMGRITKDGCINNKVGIRWAGFGDEDGKPPKKSKVIRLHRNMPINSYDPSD
jgi:hypothetical protein